MDSKKEKLEYVECSCGSELIRLSYDTEDEWCELSMAFWDYGQPYNSFKLKERIRWCWRILTHGKPYDDMVLLDTIQAAKIRSFIDGYLGWANAKIDNLLKKDVAVKKDEPPLSDFERAKLPPEFQCGSCGVTWEMGEEKPCECDTRYIVAYGDTHTGKKT